MRQHNKDFYYTCPQCGSYFNIDDYGAQTCIYCGGTGVIDCIGKEHDYDFCNRCGCQCSRYGELEEEYEEVLEEYRRPTTLQLRAAEQKRYEEVKQWRESYPNPHYEELPKSHPLASGG